MDKPETGREAGANRSTVAAWAAYDIGNTMFFTGVVGIFFPLWVTQTQSGDDATVGYTLAAVMALSLVIAPIVGTLSDYAQRRVRFLAPCTLVGVAAISLTGSMGFYVSLSLFVLAAVGINTATTIYNAMLADVSTASNRGRIGGIGVGVGYLGAIAAVAIGLIFIQSKGYVFGFRAIAVSMLVVSAPLLILFKERRGDTEALSVTRTLADIASELGSTIRRVREFPGLSRFLIARFWYTLSLYTASTFAVLYGTQTVGFGPRQVLFFLLAGILVAIPSGLLWGIAVDRIGPKATLQTVLILWVVALLLGFGIPWLDLPAGLWWGVGVMSGVVVAGIGTADRPYMIQLGSVRYLGQFFGIHSMTGRLSSIVGPLAWGFISVTLGLGQPAAVLSLAAAAAISLVLVRGIATEK